MSTAANQPENLHSDAKPSDPVPDQPPSESPEEEEEEEGECGFCLFMKGGGCKETFVDWENCVKEAEDKKEDLVEKCSQVTSLLKQCMDAHSDYYAPILMAEKHAEEQVVIELEKEKQDEASSLSNQNDRELESKEVSTPSKQAEKEEEGDCGFCLFMKGDGCRDTLVDWENCVKEARENKEDLAEKCSLVTTSLLQCMDSHSDYCKPIIRTEKHVEEKPVIELEKGNQDSTVNNNQIDETENLSPVQQALEPVKAEDGQDDEEEGECGFCVFMKGGGCRDTFVDWENCVKEAEENKEDLIEKCSQVTDLLKQCMDSHSDYYAPILMAEKHVEEQAIVELEKEKLDSATSNNKQEATSHSNQK